MVKKLIYDPSKKKAILIDPLGRKAKEIYKKRIEAGENQASILPPELTFIDGRFHKVKNIVNFNNVRRITYEQIESVFGDTQLNYVKNIFAQYKGQTIEVAKRYYVMNDGVFTEIEDSVVIDIPVDGFSSWWRSWSQFLFPDSDSWIFSEEYNKSDQVNQQSQLLIMSADKVGQGNFQQYFLDGVSHCVFTPMMDWAMENYLETNSKQTKKRYKNKANKIAELQKIYANGVHKDKFQSICNDLQIGVQIDVPSTLIHKDSEYINVRSQKKPHKIFKYINTRLNHIELNEVSAKSNYEEVSQKFLNDLVNDAIEKGEYCLWKGDQNNVYQVNTLDRIYKLTEEEGYNKELNEFEDINNLREFQVEHFSNRSLSKFLLNNVNRNGSLFMNYTSEWSDEYVELKQYFDDGEDLENPEIIEFVNSLQNLNHIDMRKAYTRGSECSFYQGYLGKIWDFRKTDCIMGLGIYMIENIKNVPPVIQKLKVLWEGNSYPSPELEFYKSLGITFDVRLGCWGSTTHIDFGDDWESGMFHKEETGCSYYAKWNGCNMKLTTKERYNFICKDLEYAKLNCIQEDSDIRYNQYKGVGIIQYQKQRAYHSAQISSFIHSYCRISMVEQLLKFKNIDQIVAVQVDGIYYRGDVEIGNLFTQKEQKSLKYLQGTQYVDDVDGCVDEYSSATSNRPNNPIELHTGPGGAGKTHKNLLDKGLMYPLYVAPSWKLARNKQKEYDIESSVFYYLVCDDPDVWRPIQRNYNTLIIDEVSMMSNENKRLILQRFKNHKVIFCGDLGYQLPPVEGTEFLKGNIPEIKHTTNHRCKCPKLQKILNRCRKVLDMYDDEILPIKKILIDYGFEIHKKEDIDYSVKDLIIAKTHKSKDYYTEKYKSLNKFMIQENTRDFCNGEIIIGTECKPEGVRSSLQHAFTIHSIQGETAEERLYIDITKLNSMRMIYTALSRAKYLSQIYIIS